MKRFTETAKWNDPWFMDLPTKYKAFWLYICDQCDCAGIWEPNIRLAVAQIGEQFEFDEILEVFQRGNRIVQTSDGKLYIPNFIRFQYGFHLNPSNTAHLGVLNRLQINNIDPPVPVLDSPPPLAQRRKVIHKSNKAFLKNLPRAFEGPKDKDKDSLPLASPYKAPSKPLTPPPPPEPTKEELQQIKSNAAQELKQLKAALRSGV